MPMIVVLVIVGLFAIKWSKMRAEEEALKRAKEQREQQMEYLTRKLKCMGIMAWDEDERP